MTNTQGNFSDFHVLIFFSLFTSRFFSCLDVFFLVMNSDDFVEILLRWAWAWQTHFGAVCPRLPPDPLLVVVRKLDSLADHFDLGETLVACIMAVIALGNCERSPLALVTTRRQKRRHPFQILVPAMSDAFV